MDLKKTPIHADHIKLGAKMVPFVGWDLPVQYDSIKAEHLHVREQVGLFDVSHMGEIRVSGKEALRTLQWLTTNDVAKLTKGQAHYSLFPNKEGGVVDDLIVYCIEPEQEYLLCVNAANTEKDYKFLLENNLGANIVDESMQWGQIAVQGPLALDLLAEKLKIDFEKLPSFTFKEFSFSGSRGIIARTGYTGEDGVELFFPWGKTSALWQELMRDSKAKPIGLGARDTLRMEKKYSLYGQEITDKTNPYGAGLGWVVKPKAKEFLGKGLMLEAKEKGLSQKLVGFEMVSRGIPRLGYKVFSFDNKEVGEVTSGTLSPSLNRGIGLAFVDKKSAEIGSELKVQVHSRRLDARVVKTPFV